MFITTTLQKYLQTRLLSSIAYDSFVGRTNASAWSTASDTLNTWSVVGGSASLSVGSGKGSATAITALTFLGLGTRTTADGEILARVNASSTNYTAMGVFLRGSGSGSTYTAYRARINTNTSSQGFGIVKTVSGTTTNLSLTTFTASINTDYWIRFRAVGSSLYGRVWSSGSTEPTSWTLTLTDTSITAAGLFGVLANTPTSSDIAKFDSVTVMNATVPVVDTVLTHRLRLQSPAQDNPLGTRFKLSLPGILSLVSRLRLIAQPSTNISLRLLLQATATYKALQSRIKLLAIASRDLTLRFILFATSTTLQKNVVVRIKTALAQDTFIRTSTNTWGLASDTINTWAIPSGAATLSVSNSQGVGSGITALTFLSLGTTTLTDGEIFGQILGSTANFTALGVFLRGSGTNGSYTSYRARINTNAVNSSIAFAILKTVANTSTTLATIAFPYAVNTNYSFRFRAVGSALFAKVWVATQAEPVGWMLTVTDTSITSAGTFGIVANGGVPQDSFYVDNVAVYQVPSSGIPSIDLKMRLRFFGQMNPALMLRFFLQSPVAFAIAVRLLCSPGIFLSILLRCIHAAQVQTDLAIRFATYPLPILYAIMSRLRLLIGHDIGARLIIHAPLPPSPLPPLRSVLSHSQPVRGDRHGYALDGVALDVPSFATSPNTDGIHVPQGSTFFLTWVAPSSATMTALGTYQVTPNALGLMTFALRNGELVTGAVTLHVVVNGSNWQVQGTLAHDAIINTWTVQSQFN